MVSRTPAQKNPGPNGEGVPRSSPSASPHTGKWKTPRADISKVSDGHHFVSGRWPPKSSLIDLSGAGWPFIMKRSDLRRSTSFPYIFPSLFWPLHRGVSRNFINGLGSRTLRLRGCLALEWEWRSHWKPSLCRWHPWRLNRPGGGCKDHIGGQCVKCIVLSIVLESF